MAVSCGMGSLASHTYCVTRSGFLCLFNKDRRLESFIECKVEDYCACDENVFIMIVLLLLLNRLEQHILLLLVHNLCSVLAQKEL